MTDFTIDELMVCCIARQIKNGEIIVQGLATPLVGAAFLLARNTHAPDLYFASAIGQGVCREPAPLGLVHIEELWLDRALINVGFVSVAADILPRLRPKEFFRPAQVDANGNFNNLAIGSDYHHPRLRLPGSGGIPDVTVVNDQVYLYVTRHSRVTFVPQLDFRSGLGHAPERNYGAGPRYLITNLGQFDFLYGKMRLTSIHPGVTLDRIQSKTGFPLEIAPDVVETPAPAAEELELIRNQIDPLGIRKLELLSGAPRRELLERIIQIETAE
jgi:acyl CoA:acetate/3-ketoacid CoA transferase beta subunit